MKKIALLLVCLLCLNGCSVKLVYNFLDFAMSWQLKRFVTLEGAQKDLAAEKIRDFHDWHRRTQLPEYAAYIDSVLNYIRDNEVNGNWIHKETDKVQEMIDVSANYLKPFIVELAASFSDKQVDELLDNLAQRREKFRKKHVQATENKLRKYRKNELVDNIGPFFGRLNEAQERLIEAWLDELQNYEHLTLKQQKLWATKLQNALNQRSDQQALAKNLDTLMFYRTDDWDPELERILDHNQAITYRLLAELYNSQTPKQRKKTLAKLTNYRDDFLSLAARKD